MKRQHAEIGVKYWGNEDLLDLQGEPLKALDGFFAQYGPCIVQGCGITPSGDVFDIDPGLVVLEGKDHRGETVTMIVPFEGVTETSLPVFLTLEYQARVREYGDGKVKPIAYDYTARASTVQPAEGTAFLRIAADEASRFVDVLGDEKHSFITDIERAVWNAKETPAGAQQKADKALADAKGYADSGDGTTLEAAKVDASVKSEAALRNAKSYTDTREGIVRTDYANADASTLVSAKAYADQVVAALVDGSPEALDTLQELAAALGNDPNFATTVMNEIGKRATTEAMNAALAGKLDKSGGTMSGNLVLADGVKVSNAAGQNIAAFMAFASTAKRMVYGNINVPTLLLSNGPLKRRTAEPEVDTEYTVWDAGNLDKNVIYLDRGVIAEADLNAPAAFALKRGVYGVTMSGGRGTLLNFIANSSVSPVQFYVDSYSANNALKWRSGVDNNKFNNANFRTIYDSGNLTAATTSANGLMSAADKQKLDRIGDGVTSKCCGRVNSDGGFVGGFGCAGSVRIEKGKYRVYHNMGHTNYAVTVTMTPVNTDTYDNTPMVMTISTSYFDVWMGTGPGSLEDTGFYFITMPYQ